MKQVILFFVCVTFATLTKAQLQNTKWLGSIDAGGSPLEIVFDFGKDTLNVINNGDGSTIETLTYSVTADSVVTFKKITGQSSCGDEEGKYKYSVNGKDVVFTKVEDDCYDRVNALDNMKYTKQD